MNSGLVPAVSISVAPRGIEPAPMLDPEPDGGDAMPFEESFAGTEPQPTLEVSPPPSNTEFAALAALLEPPGAKDVFDEQLLLTAGLSPRGSISVAPNGMPALVSPLDEPGTPSGDVAAGAGRVAVLCAKVAPQLNRIAAARNNNRNIAICSILLAPMSALTENTA